MARAKKAAIEMRTGAGGESAYIAGTRVRVSDIARLYPRILDEMLIERIVRSLPTLDPEQVAGALSYWREHSAQIDAEIEKEERVAGKLEAQAFHDLALNGFAEAWESQEDSIYDDILEDARSQ